MKKWVKALLAVFVICVVFIIATTVYAADYYHAVGVEAYMTSDETVAVTKIEDRYFFDGPGTGDALIFYPGGKVDETAYAPLMRLLAEQGTDCFLLKMPLRLAVLDGNRADEILEKYGYENYYLAGHSLGGVAAAAYLNDSPEREYEGLILCASYTTQDLSDSDLRLLSIYGSNDKVLNMESYEKNRANWPAESEEIIISGGIHSYFGSYGIQKGDGQPEMSNAEQIKEAADHIADWAY